jgi:hypothetical protein
MCGHIAMCGRMIASLSIGQHIERIINMSQVKLDRIKRTLSEGLAMANRGNVFWTRTDAMQSFNLFHNNARKGV